MGIRDPFYCLDIATPPPRGGGGGRGLALRMLLPVGVLIRLVARGKLPLHILHASFAEFVAVWCVIAAAAARAHGLGASGFFDVLSGAHANIVTHSW